MTWTPEQMKAACAAIPCEADRNYLSDRQMVAIMNYARDALAANGGTMTAGALEGDLLTVAGRAEPLPDTAGRLRQHIAAQGAKVAELTGWLADLTEVLCGERPVGDGVLPSTTLEAARAITVKVATLEEQVEGLTATLEDEQAAHVDALRLTKEERDEALRSHGDLVLSASRQLSALQDEIDRLKPSDQVAEDVELIEAEIDRGPDFVVGGRSKHTLHAALSRLAALAQREHGGTLSPDAPGRAVYEAGAEDMRAACWEALQVHLRKNGYVPEVHPAAWGGFKAAIEGAVP